MSELPASKKPRTRSPAYPATDLKDAVQKSAILWEKLNRHWASSDTVVTLWGYDSHSSAGYSVLSALIKFGLIEDRGSGDKREVRLTEAAISLVYHADPESSEHKMALQRAALMPAIHAELWKKYEGRFPDDPVIERYLVLDRGFNSAYVKGFIKEFKQTLSFAELTEGDIVESQPESPTSRSSMPSSPRLDLASTQPATVAKRGFTPPASSDHPPSTVTLNPAGLIEIPVPLPSGVIAYYRVPSSMTEADFVFYRSLWDAYKPGLVRPAALEAQSSPEEQI